VKRAARLLAVFVAFATAAAAVACAGVGDPGATLSVQFDSLPSPAVVYGDTLRDSTGAVSALQAKAYDALGRRIPTATFSYASLDTGVRVDAGGRVIATGWRTAVARLVATTGVLQSKVVNVLVTRRPDSLMAGAADTLSYGIGQANLSSGAQVRLRSRQFPIGATGDSVSPGWVVRYELVSAPVPPADTLIDSVFVVGDDGKRSSIDTTDATGLALRRLRVVPHPGSTRTDSVVMRAYASYRGVPVLGSPARLVVVLRRAQ
jgi:hypothetical protein